MDFHFSMNKTYNPKNYPWYPLNELIVTFRVSQSGWLWNYRDPIYVHIFISRNSDPQIDLIIWKTKQRKRLYFPPVSLWFSKIPRKNWRKYLNPITLSLNNFLIQRKKFTCDQKVIFSMITSLFLFSCLAGIRFCS